MFSSGGAQGAESVGGHSGQKPLGKRNRVKYHALVIVPEAGKFFAQNAVVKRRVVGDKDRPFGHLHDALGDFVESRSRAHVVLPNARQFLDKGRNRNLWTHQRNELVNNAASVKHKDGHLNDAFRTGFASGGFEINYGVHN